MDIWSEEFGRGEGQRVEGITAFSKGSGEAVVKKSRQSRDGLGRRKDAGVTVSSVQLPNRSTKCQCWNHMQRILIMLILTFKCGVTFRVLSKFDNKN